MGHANISRRGFLGMLGVAGASAMLPGCSAGDSAAAGKTQIEVVTYKQEAVSIFETLQDAFNATHDDIYLKITCPNDAITILKTRFIRNNYPDIIGIGGELSDGGGTLHPKRRLVIAPFYPLSGRREIEHPVPLYQVIEVGCAVLRRLLGGKEDYVNAAPGGL